MLSAESGLRSGRNGGDSDEEEEEGSDEFKDTDENVNGESLATLAQQINQMKIEKEVVGDNVKAEADELDIDLDDEDLEDLDDVDDVELSDWI